MTKRQLIDEIVSINHTAKPVFLARFNELDLDEYLQHLIGARTSSITGDYSRYKKYFSTQSANSPSVMAEASPAVASAKPDAVASTCYQSSQADEQFAASLAEFDCDSDEALAGESSARIIGSDEHADHQESENHAGVLVRVGNPGLPAYNNGSGCSSPFAKAQADGKWLF
jgi:hypothetical protein